MRAVINPLVKNTNKRLCLLCGKKKKSKPPWDLEIFFDILKEETNRSLVAAGDDFGLCNKKGM